MGELASLGKGKTLAGWAEENHARQGSFWHRQGGELGIALPWRISGAIVSSHEGALAQVRAALQNESMQTNGVTTETPGENSNGTHSPANPNRSVPSESDVPKTPALLEAQGWVYGQNGNSHCPISYHYTLQSLIDTCTHFLQCQLKCA